MSDSPPNRLERRKKQTRDALIRAAQQFMADGRLNGSVQDICQAADVGVGSFYNHFESKEELFLAALHEILDAHGALLDALTQSLEDPAEVFARSFRLTGRLYRLRPDVGRIALDHGLGAMSAERGLAPRAKRDISAAIAAGRFRVTDAELAVALAGGALLGVGQLLQNQPERDSGQTTDQATEDILRMFGMPAQEAHELSNRPLPDLDTPGGPAA
ncbi:TetR/AcrR family transcriptional regulator [Mycobacteroides abscessus subsp. massiliense]|uniref:TetR/AcrR family transcriptional regulator n=1 Tax=Mycobacteroides abscessus TaxID=36809 RepID=UPI00266C4DEA|nr:TetR/AcrR family transcriptional regulator [Mycobacteroides abscessus]MDO3297754.1 TetR/AcrR family transcriptional regulator [Mycobacteroides abscessus subsp. massiliense]